MKKLERLTKRKVHFLGQTTHVVMGLDDLARDIKRLDSVGINGTLGQPLRILDLLGFSIEHLDEVASNDLTLLLGVTHTCQVGKELLRSIHADYIEAETLVVVHHIAELILSKHAVIDEDTGEIFADSAIEEHGCHT